MLTKEVSRAAHARVSFVEPMYAQLVRELPAGDAWTYEAKLDGYRCLAAKQGKAVVLWSRRGNLFTSRFPEIARAFEPLAPDTMIDGEVVAVNESGRISFNALQHHHRSNTPTFSSTLLTCWCIGAKFAPPPAGKTAGVVGHVLAKTQYPVLRSTPFEANPSELIRAAKGLGMGIVAKRKGSSTSLANAAAQAQVQNPQLAGVRNRWLHTGPSVLCANRRLLRRQEASLRRQGAARVCAAAFAGLETKGCPFANLPEKRRTMWALTAEEMKECRWLKPQLVAHIEFNEWTPDGHLRHSSFVAMRDDKDARAVRRE